MECQYQNGWLQAKKLAGTQMAILFLKLISQ